MHIDKMKKRYLRSPFMGCAKGMSYAQYIACSNDPERDCKYWKVYFLSGPRQYAKKSTSCVLRSQWRKYKTDIFRMDAEDLDDCDGFATNGCWYRKAYYWGTVW